MNTSGGNFAEAYILGMGHHLEAVRQLRGTSTNQVPGAAVSAAMGGPMTSLTSGVLYGTEETRDRRYYCEPTGSAGSGGAGSIAHRFGPAVPRCVGRPRVGAPTVRVRHLAVAAGSDLPSLSALDPGWDRANAVGRVFSWTKVWHAAHAALRLPFRTWWPSSSFRGPGTFGSSAICCSTNPPRQRCASGQPSEVNSSTTRSTAGPTPCCSGGSPTTERNADRLRTPSEVKTTER